MCEVAAFLAVDSGERKIMENVVLLEPEGDLLLLRSLLGEQKLLRARLKSVDFLGNRIVLEEPRAEAAA